MLTVTGLVLALLISLGYGFRLYTEVVFGKTSVSSFFIWRRFWRVSSWCVQRKIVGRQGVFIGLGSKSLKGSEASGGSVASVSSVSLEAVKLKSLVSLVSSDSETLAGRQEQFWIRYSWEEAWIAEMRPASCRWSSASNACSRESMLS
jgi:hypothetical protein